MIQSTQTHTQTHMPTAQSLDTSQDTNTLPLLKSIVARMSSDVTRTTAPCGGAARWCEPHTFGGQGFL